MYVYAIRRVFRDPLVPYTPFPTLAITSPQVHKTAHLAFYAPVVRIASILSRHHNSKTRQVHSDTEHVVADDMIHDTSVPDKSHSSRPDE